MTLKVNEIVPREEYVQILDDIYAEARDKVGPNKALLTDISTLVNFGKEITTYAHEYDFNGVQANGYWSLLRIGIHYLRYGLKHYTVNDPGNKINNNEDQNNNNRSTDFNGQFATLIEGLVKGCRCISHLRKDSIQSGSSEGLPLQASELALTANYFNNIITADFKQWEPLIDEFAGCYHSYWGQVSTYFLFYLVSLLGCAGTDLPKWFTNSYFRKTTLVRIVKQFDSAVISFMASFSENIIACRISPLSVHGFQPKITRAVYIQRQKKYMIDYDMDAKNIFLVKDSPEYMWGQKPVRCRLLYKPDPEKTPDSLVLHCHGGGFVTGSPDSHEIYLRGWAKELPGVPVLSIDFSLSPENKFPVASQQILDVYLWLISDDPGVEEMLGFTPKRIVFTGDSSGGLQMMALMMTLNDIRKQFKDPSVRLPYSFVGFYCSFTIEPMLTPSCVLSCFHSFLFPTVFTNMVDDYLPDGQRPALDCMDHLSFLVKAGDMLWSSVTYGYRVIAWYWKMYKNLYNDPCPWFMKGVEGIEQRLLKDINFTKHPYLSPLNYDDFESLSEVSIQLVTVLIEPILDHSIMMAKKWKGSVKLEVFGELTHAFLNLVGCEGQYREAYRLSVQKLKDALDIEY